MPATKKYAATNARSFRSFLLVQQFAAHEIGARIAQARREANGMTQETLGDLIGVSKRMIQNYESGATIPWKHLREIGNVLNREVDWFLRGEEAAAAVPAASPMPLSDAERLARLERIAEEVLETLRRMESSSSSFRESA